MRALQSCALAGGGWLCGVGEGLLGEDQFAQRGSSQAVDRPAMLDMQFVRTVEQLVAAEGAGRRVSLGASGRVSVFCQRCRGGS